MDECSHRRDVVVVEARTLSIDNGFRGSVQRATRKEGLDGFSSLLDYDVEIPDSSPVRKYIAILLCTNTSTRTPSLASRSIPNTWRRAQVRVGPFVLLPDDPREQLPSISNYCHSSGDLVILKLPLCSIVTSGESPA